MACRHHPLLPLFLTAALVLGACSSGEDSPTAAATTDEGVTTEAPAPPTTMPIDEQVDEQPIAEESGEEEPAETDGVEELFPDVLDATATQEGDGTWTVSATLSSPYDSPERYADAWRVLGPDGTELGVRVLTHDHASEQPFTRSHSGIEIPEDVEVVTIQGRDQVSGWGGDTFELALTDS